MESKFIIQQNIPYRNHLSQEIVPKVHSRSQYEDNKFYNVNNYDRDSNYIGKLIDGEYENVLRNKPLGLWYSLQWHWLNYDKLEYDIIPNKKYDYDGYLYNIELNNDCTTDISDSNKDKILILNNNEDKYIFYVKYQLNTHMGEIFHLINWAKVANDYGGLEISDLNRSNQLKHRWSYGWDVPSGCIWNADIINKFDLINE